MERSIAGQIEFWASIGRALEQQLRLPEVMALKQSGALRPLRECVAIAGTPAGRAQLKEALAQRPYPHFDQADRPGLIVKIEADGSRQVGRFINRRFQVIDET